MPVQPQEEVLEATFMCFPWQWQEMPSQELPQSWSKPPLLANTDSTEFTLPTQLTFQSQLPTLMILKKVTLIKQVMLKFNNKSQVQHMPWILLSLTLLSHQALLLRLITLLPKPWHGPILCLLVFLGSLLILVLLQLLPHIQLELVVPTLGPIQVIHIPTEWAGPLKSTPAHTLSNIPIPQESSRDANSLKTIQNFHASFMTKQPKLAQPVTPVTPLSMENVLKAPAQPVNTRNTVFVLTTQPDVPLTVISLDAPNVPPASPLKTESAARPHSTVPEELGTTLLPTPAIQSMTSAENGPSLMENVLHASAQQKRPWTESVLKPSQPVPTNNTSMPLEPVSMLIHSANSSKRSEENAQNVFGPTNGVSRKANVSRLFAKTDTFPTIMENAPKSVIFVILLTLMEFVWLASQPTLWETEFASKSKPHSHALTDNIWVKTTSVTKSANIVPFTTRMMVNAQNASTVSFWCTLENVSSRRPVNQDKFWSTTTATMLAQHAETTTEPQESALTVPVTSMNFTMDFVFLRPDVELDNGLTMMDNAMKSTPDVIPTTHQPENAPAVSKDTVSWMESAAFKANSTKMENVLMPLMLPKLSMITDVPDSCMVLDVLFVTMASKELKINMGSFSVKPFDCFYIYF